MRGSFWVQRFAQLLITVFCVTFGCSLLVQLLPVSPAEILLPVGSPEERELLTKEIGLDRGPIGYYLKWLGEFVTETSATSITQVAPKRCHHASQLPFRGRSC